MKKLFFILYISLLYNVCTCTWPSTILRQPELFTKNLPRFNPTKCNVKNGDGSHSCVSCLVIKEDMDHEPINTICISVTSRLRYQEIFVRINSLNNRTILEEVMPLLKDKNYGPREGFDTKILGGEGEPTMRVYPTFLLEKVNYVNMIKFCVEAGYRKLGIGARWCYNYNGEDLESSDSSSVILVSNGLEKPISEFTPVKFKGGKYIENLKESIMI